jgi:Ca2+-binding EF-hand superfamily protein
MYMQAMSPNSRDAMVRAFKTFDARGLGVITSAEFRAIFESAGVDVKLEPQVVDDLLEYADEAMAGQVGYVGFVNRLMGEYEAAKARDAEAAKK